MTASPLRMLIAGGDATVWVGLSAALSDRSSQIFVARNDDLRTALETASDLSIVILAAGSGLDVAEALAMCKESGLERRTILIAESENGAAIGHALALGLGGYVLKGSSIEKLAAAVGQVVDGGLSYDGPAATALRDALNLNQSEKSSGMSAALALASALELKDTYTGGHAERVTALATRLARAASLDDAIPNEALEVAFLLHDVGKIGIPESILTKPGGLTDIERKVLETHPILGERIVAPLDFPDCVRQVVRHHHERWDGSGYPDGLSGFAIPGPARIFSIADVLDAMTSVRPYRRPIPFREAMDYVMSKAGTQFDPALCALTARVLSTEPVENDLHQVTHLD